MSKEFDKQCQLCHIYDTCNEENSQNCDKYEYYKCKECVDRIVENDEIPKCFRGGIPCMEIRYCSNERRAKE